MYKRIFTILLTLVLLIGTTFAASAETATVGIIGGSLTVSPADVSLGSVTLDGTDKTATSAFGGNAWRAEDARGTGVGWNVTIISTNFTDGGTPLRTIDISAVDQKFKIQIETANISVIAGSAVPTSSVTGLTDIPFTGAPALKIVSAAATGVGMGEYNIPPAFSLMVPAETYVGTGSYTATITVSAVTGP